MKFFIILTLLISDNAGSYNFQKKLQPNTEEIIQIIEHFNDIEYERIHTILNDYKISYNLVGNEDTIQTYFSKVNDMINDLSSHLRVSVYMHFDSLLAQYCLKALEFVSQLPIKGYKSDIVSIVDHDFCVVAFIEVFNTYVAERYFNISLFLRTISFYELKHDALKEKLLKIITDYMPEAKRYIKTSKENILEITKELNTIKEKIKKFSNFFCLSSIQTQLVHKYTFSDGNKNKNPFIHYIFQEEKCKIYTNILKPENELSSDVKSKKWDCSHILDTAEFRFSDYSKDINRTAYSTYQRLKNLGSYAVKATIGVWYKDKSDGVGKTLKVKPKKPLPTEFEKTLSGDNIISLSELKDKYKRDSTLNLRDFNSIITDVIIHVSVKVGVQLLKGIKNVFTRNCEVKTTNFQNIMILNSRLYMFQSFFDEFIIGLSNINNANIAERREVNYFVEQVNSFMELLEDAAYGKMNFEDACTKIEDLLDDKLDAYRISESAEFLFDEYYLTDPINYIYTLYKFDVSL